MKNKFFLSAAVLVALGITSLALAQPVAEPCIEVEKSVDCDVSMPGSTITYHITITNCGTETLNRVSVVDSLIGPLDSGDSCATLDPNTSCTFDVNYPVPPDFNATALSNVITVVYEDSNTVTATDCMIVHIIHPDFTVTKNCITQPIPPGGPASFQIVITNTGDVGLDFVTSDPFIPPFSLAPEGVRTFDVNLPFDGNDVFNQIIVDANLPDDSCFQLCCDIVKEANDTCLAEPNDQTRTWGFWAQHCDFTTRIFNCCNTSIDLGFVQITDINELFGIFRAHNDKKNCDVESKLCKARIQASVQAIAAILNTCLPNGAALPVSLADISSTLGSCDIKAIRELGETLAAFNESGDSDVTLFDCNGLPQGRATGDCAKRLGDCTDFASACNACNIAPPRPSAPKPKGKK